MTIHLTMMKRTGTAIGAVPIVLLAAAGCQPAPHAPSEGAWGNATVVEELSIGVEYGADEYMFGRVQSVAVAADDTIYVSEGQVPIVRIYEGDGTFVGNIGGRGEGPGEYVSAPGLAVLPDGRLVTRDSSRVSVFSRDGEYLGKA